MDDQKPTSAPKAYNDIEALQKCSAIIERVEPAQDRLRVVRYLQEKYLTVYSSAPEPSPAAVDSSTF